MLNREEKQRMEQAKETRVKTNCIGTVLYILGLSKTDTYVGFGEERWDEGIVDDLLNQMTKVAEPQAGGLLVLRDEVYVGHLGIIIQKDPTLVYHRPGLNGRIEPEAQLDEVISCYSSYYPRREFYIKNTSLPSARV